MVVVEVNSGLGNQMFQYAAGYSLASRLNVPLLLDTSWYNSPETHQTPRNFELGVFGFSIQEAHETDVDRVFRLRGNSWLQRFRNRLNRSKPYYLQRVYVEPHFHYDIHFEAARSPVMLSGYWQSERYFNHVAHEIRSLFTLPLPNSLTNYLSQMQSGTSISVHIRRGDMINNPEVMQVHGYCNLDYYKEAIRIMKENFPDCRFFVFSDDLSWCRENLAQSGDFVFVEGNTGSKAYLDIQLMRSCHHHIIANSSFSWWGAWLNPNPHKKVIAPINWFAHNRHNTSDLIPSSWLRI